jgi:hypothetical protein
MTLPWIAVPVPRDITLLEETSLFPASSGFSLRIVGRVSPSVRVPTENP